MTRDLVITTGDAESLVLAIRVYRPEFDPKMNCYACRYELEAADEFATETLFGADGVQALLLTLGFLEIDVGRLIATKRGQVAPESLAAWRELQDLAKSQATET